MDAILYWNQVALEANRTDFSGFPQAPQQSGPTLSSRALAIVHLAMYDAFVGVDKTVGNPSGYDHYLDAPPVANTGASADAAIAAAAYATLSVLFPSQQPFFNLKHAEAGLSGGGVKDGHDYGHAIAQQLLNARKNDPSPTDLGYVASLARGRHRPDPDNPGQGFHAPFYGAGSKCFATKVRYALASPPLDDAAGEYVAALQQVRFQGIAPELMGTLPALIGGNPPPRPARTANETVRGIYWAYDGPVGLGTPPRLYNQIVREVAQKIANPKNGGQPNTLAQNARLFALVNAAMGDAGILAWEQKYVHDFWRPVVGIREHDLSLGPTGTAGNGIDENADPGWLPLGAPRTNSPAMEKNFTPPFPAYPSGHATFGAAAFHITRRFYGTSKGDTSRDDLFKDLAFVSEELNGVNRDNKGTVRPRHLREFLDGLWQMIIENGLSRVDLGVHWVFDAFAVDASGQPNLAKGTDAADESLAGVGGVPLGLKIADDIYDTDMRQTNGADPSEPVPTASLFALAPRKPWPLG